MAGRQGQAGVEIGECGFRLPERRLRAAATEQGIGVTRIALERLRKTRERFARASKDEQRVAAVEQCVDIAGAQRQRLVEAVERFGVTLERVEHVGEIYQSVGRPGGDLERSRDKPGSL